MKTGLFLKILVRLAWTFFIAYFRRIPDHQVAKRLSVRAIAFVKAEYPRQIAYAS
jgi:hypothetical protein